jgi:carboxylate-amine ligase
VDLDLDTACHTFAAATDLTVGLEEEFQLLDPGSLALIARFEDLRDAAGADRVLGESISGELISSEIEIRSGRGEDLFDAVARQRDRRRRLFALAAARGVALGATGTHPFADYRDQHIIETDHYRRVEDGLRYVAWRNNTFSLHVHAGVRGADRAVRVCDRLRPVLPLLLAISANSPFLDGRDSGLASARSLTFTRTFPRCGIPDAFGSWAAFARYVELLVATDSIVEYTQVWWSIRPHIAFGTVEVRICDAQTTAAEAEALGALILGCIAQAARDEDEGAPEAFGCAAAAGSTPGRLIEENMWRAIRYGLEGRFIDLARGCEYPAPEAIDRLLDWTAPVRGELGIVPELSEHGGAQRQRQMLRSGVSMQEVFAATVRESAESYAQEVTVST